MPFTTREGNDDAPIEPGAGDSNGDDNKAARAAVEKHLLAVLGASADAVVDEPVGD